MLLYVYDASLNPLGVIENMLSMLWKRRFREPGEFAMEVPYSAEARELLATGNLVMQPGGNEAMEIDYIRFSRNQQDMDTIQVQGRSLMQWLERRVTASAVESFGTLTPQALLRNLVNQNAVNPSDLNRKLPLYYNNRAAYTQDTIDYQADRWESLLDCVEELLSVSGMGCRVLSDPTTKRHTIDFLESTNKVAGTADQCIFAVEFGTLGQHDYTYSTQTLFNMAYIEGGDEITTSVGGSLTGLNRRETSFSYSDISLTWTDIDEVEHTQTEAQVRTKCQSRARSELARDHAVEQTFEGEAVTFSSALRYKEDYDLGDKVTCIATRWGVRADVVITEVSEEYKNGRETVELTFGDGRPTLKLR